MRVKTTTSVVLVVALLAAVALSLAVTGCGGGETTTTAAPGSATTAPETGTTAGADADPLIIGAALGLVGDAAPGDVPLAEALEYAVDQVNAEGGIAGHKVELVVKDMKSDPALAATVTKELLDAGAVILVGPAFPGMGAGVVQTAAAAGVPVLCGTSTQPEYVKIGGAKAYLVAFGDNVQAAAAAEYATSQGYKTVYTLTSPDLSYTARLPEFFLTTFEEGGGASVGDDNFSLGQQDFSAQVTKIAALEPEPDVIYTGMFPPDVGVFLKQLRAAGVTSAFIGADGLDQQPLIDFAGEDAEGVVFATHGYPNPGGKFKEFIDGLTADSGKAPDAPALASLGGDLMAVVKAAVIAAGSIDPEAIGTALGELEDVPVVNGTITYKGTDGVPMKTVALVTVKEGKFIFIDEMVPSFIPPQ
ncbi:MAG: ABC transporter substrate-binding protein [Thermoleophilia bacterium]